MELFELEDRIDELKKQLAAEQTPTVAKAMKRLERRLLGGPPGKFSLSILTDTLVAQSSTTAPSSP